MQLRTKIRIAKQKRPRILGGVRVQPCRERSDHAVAVEGIVQLTRRDNDVAGHLINPPSPSSHAADTRLKEPLRVVGYNAPAGPGVSPGKSTDLTAS